MMLPETTSGLLTSAELMTRLGITRKEMQRALASGLLPRRKVGDRLRFTEEDIARFVAGQKHAQSKQVRDFDVIYWPDGTCTIGNCGEKGVILAYDTFSPEIGMWFCEACWEEFEPLMDIVEDRRPKETAHG
ncbi:MAG TPA: helix-turn-helix domain-containing protein [Ktedonobacteraceae bacterium]|nr:helix-turn-helix domain-containing protein [Ktedonobacteraceae bacterium]